MTKTVKSDSFLHRRLQLFVAGSLFPAGKGDWYKSKNYGSKPDATVYKTPFDDFVEQQKTNEKAHYFKDFQNLNLNLKSVKSQLANGDTCELEVFQCQPEKDAPKKPGTGKHIVYFPGANTYYQACFRDISAASKETGATVHAFNFPGTGLSTGQVREANDLTNAGISVVCSLIKSGVSPDDIILQGDCYGAGVALEVKKQLAEQADIKVRLVMNNAFKSFKAAVCDMITQSPWLPSILKGIVKRLLEFTGWHVTPGKNYIQSDPYQCHIQHLGDQTLSSSTLSEKVSKYRNEMATGETSSEKRAAHTDTCPEEYKADRDELDRKHVVRVKESSKKRLGEKFGYDQFGRVNAHFADICELEMLDGQSVYTGFINDYITRSDRYIQEHRQKDFTAALDNVHFLAPADGIEITQDEADDFNYVVELLTEEQNTLQQALGSYDSSEESETSMSYS
jgi:hypothetical protein